MNRVDALIAGVAAKQHGVFNRRQAVEVGASASACDRRTRSGLWLPTDHVGVFRLHVYTPTWHQRLMAAVLGGPEGTLVSHRAAAVLHGLREGSPLELIVPPAANPRVGRVRAHRSIVTRHDRATVNEIPTTKIDRTLVDLAGVVDEGPLEQALEAALRLGLTTDERVRRRLEELAAPGRAGVVRLRRVLERRVKGRPAGSELEVRLLQLLRAAGLEEPVRQFEVVVGPRRYFIDLAFPLRRLAVEFDGMAAHTDFQSDRARQNDLVLAGWTVLRFTWADVMERPGDVIAAICGVMAA